MKDMVAIEEVSGVHFGNHFGRDDDQTKVSKQEMCSRLGACALIDDSMDYARECAENSIPVVLFGNYSRRFFGTFVELSINASLNVNSNTNININSVDTNVTTKRSKYSINNINEKTVDFINDKSTKWIGKMIDNDKFNIVCFGFDCFFKTKNEPILIVTGSAYSNFEKSIMEG